MTTVPQELFQNTSLTLTGYIPTCYRHCKYKNHRRKLIFSSSLFSTQMLDFLAAFRPKANMPPKRVFPNYQFCIVEKISLWFPNPLAYPHPLYLTVSYFRIYLNWTCDTSRKYIFKIYLKWQCQQGGNISFLRYLKWTCIMEEMHYI